MTQLPRSKRPNGWSLLPPYARHAAIVLALLLLLLAFAFPLIVLLPLRLPAKVASVYLILLFTTSILSTIFAFWASVLDARGRKRRRTGRCPRCNYDVRATPDASGPSLPTCPECGQPL